MSDGTPWRPLIHCRDIARAFVAFADGHRESISNQAVNIGSNSENYQVRAIGDIVQELVPSAKVVCTGEVGADPRNYRVNFDKLGSLLPEFKLQYNLRSGMWSSKRNCFTTALALKTSTATNLCGCVH